MGTKPVCAPGLVGFAPGEGRLSRQHLGPGSSAAGPATFQSCCLISLFQPVFIYCVYITKLINSKFSFDVLRLSSSLGITVSAPYRIVFINVIVVCHKMLT